MAGGLITYEENGFPVELVSDRDIARAVAQGKLRPETIVREYGADGTASTGRADHFERLKAYFTTPEETDRAAPNEPAAPARASRTEHLPAGPAISMAPAAVFEAVPEAVVQPQPTAAPEDDFEEGAAESDPPERPGASGGTGLLAIVAFVLIAGAMLLFATLNGRGGSSSVPAETIVANTVDAVDPTEAIGAETSYWANREVRVRRAPGTASPAVGSLKRGDPVRGVQVRGPSGEGEWIRVEAGQFAGGYAWIKNFSTAERPILILTASRPRKLAGTRNIYAEPDLTSTVLVSVGAGAPVRLAGLTMGGWWELALDGGGVGYVERETEFASCSGIDCHVLTPDGWGEFRVGSSVEAAEAAGAMSLIRPGHYDEIFTEEPGRLRSCNIHNVTGAPPQLTIFVQDGAVTSVGAGLGEGGSGVRFETERGIALGDGEEAVRAAYPELEQEPDIYSGAPDKKLFYRRGDGKGIKFSIVGGRVSHIDGGGNSIDYVEGCL